MGKDLKDQVAKITYFKDDFLGKPVKFKDREVYGIVTFLMKDVAKITYVDKKGEIKEKSINCEYALKNLEYPAGYSSYYISVEYICNIECGTPVSIYNPETQKTKYMIMQRQSNETVWFVGVEYRNGEHKHDSQGIQIDAILSGQRVIESLI